MRRNTDESNLSKMESANIEMANTFNMGLRSPRFRHTIRDRDTLNVFVSENSNPGGLPTDDKPVKK